MAEKKGLKYMVHLILKYAKSHIYELHALLAGTMAFFIMFWAKKPVKAEIRSYAEKKAEISRRWQENRKVYCRRMGLCLIVMDLVLSGAIFGLLSVVSPLIHFSMPMVWLSGSLSLTEYAVYEQITCGKKREYHE